MLHYLDLAAELDNVSSEAMTEEEIPSDTIAELEDTYEDEIDNSPELGVLFGILTTVSDHGETSAMTAAMAAFCRELAED